ncbi:NAD(P)-dependent alcohol dehydrogenase [Marinobacter sp. ANT_B65]|uniref:NAD(P)-dependent alcohol dehydrogenase n=1 Tax=Marinobacter sp. ANT_B65 TaxID=2039467 RepID=UPI000BBEE374|nr:NAD(P)-dependent alcohol dehydrogenase [Marinobacter sp. ANT_B65]PCM44096.1 aryl-alcohol dehydrogenase [Marinobacter sp. ANT_B65]
MEIKAAVTHSQGEPFKLEPVQLADPDFDEIRVRIVGVGVCHTDVVARDLGIAPFPIVLGHEGSGVVDSVGAGVSDLEAGDHVVLSFAHCGNCGHCLTGHPTVCDTFNDLNFGGAMDDGSRRLAQGKQSLATFFGQSSFATYAIAKSRNAVKVDPDVDIALLGPLGCGIQTGAGTVLNRLKPEFGSSIVVYGAGAVGLSAVMAARIVGCQYIIAVDVHDSRLALAKELGATHIFNGKNVDVVAEVKKLTGSGSHYAVETTGVPPVVKQSLNALRPLGTVAIVGITPEVSLDIHNDLMAEGKSMIGVIEGDSIPRVFIPQLIAYYKSGKFPFDKLVRFYEFDQINQAFEDSASGITIKPVLKVG